MNQMAERLPEHVPRGLADQKDDRRSRLHQLLHGPGVLVDTIADDRVDALVAAPQPRRPPMWRSTRDHVQFPDILAHLQAGSGMSVLSQKLFETVENRNHP